MPLLPRPLPHLCAFRAVSCSGWAQRETGGLLRALLFPPVGVGVAGSQYPCFPVYEVPPKTQELKDLIKSSAALKGILSGIPDQIEDRTKFLGIIRDIASAIKNLLDAINAVATENAALVKSQKNNLEANKKKFVRGSKTFSDTLKAFFKDGKYVSQHGCFPPFAVSRAHARRVLHRAHCAGARRCFEVPTT